MDIDHSGGATDGTVYVTWSDLRTGSGTTRCDDSTPPATTQLTWDSFVATATNALPGGAGPSASVGTRLITGAEGGAAADDWFPSVAVDQSNGAAWADVYSTLLDSTRRTMQVFARPVGVERAERAEGDGARRDQAGAGDRCKRALVRGWGRRRWRGRRRGAR